MLCCYTCVRTYAYVRMYANQDSYICVCVTILCVCACVSIYANLAKCVQRLIQTYILTRTHIHAQKNEISDLFYWGFRFFVSVYMYSYIYTYICRGVQRYIRGCVCVGVCVCACVCGCIHVYMYKYDSC